MSEPSATTSSKSQSFAASLPTELLERIASFVDRPSLLQCILVSKFWLSVFRAVLWRDLSLHDYIIGDFMDQFQLYYNLVRRITISIPCASSDINVLLGYSSPPKPKSKSPVKTLLDCKRLKTLNITFEDGVYDSPWGEFFDEDTFADTILQLIKNNTSTLREFKFANLRVVNEDDVLDEIKMMASLESLSLHNWDYIDGKKLLDLFKNGPSTLRTLSLEMNDMSADEDTFKELQAWRKDVENNFKEKAKDKGTSSEDELVMYLGSNLTGITSLRLDRCSIDQGIVLRLTGVMPHLRVLSLKDTYGLGIYMGDNFESSLSNIDAEVNSILAANIDNNGLNDMGVDGIQVTQAANELLGEDDAGSLHIGHGPSESGVQEHAYSEADVTELGLTPPNITTATLSGGIGYDPDQDYGDDFDDYLGSGDEFDANDDIDFDFDTHYDAEEGAFESYVTPAPVTTHQLEMLYCLYRQCPRLQSFNFSGCRSDGLCNQFLTTISDLWGGNSKDPRAVSTFGMAHPTLRSLTEGLQVLQAQDVCKVKLGFFRKLSLSCSNTLTIIDLSMPNPRFNIPPLVHSPYYDDILEILMTCAHLEALHVEPYPVNGRSIQAQSSEWISTNLRSLKIYIEFDVSSDGVKDDDGVCIAVYKQLGRLVHLRTLLLEGDRSIMTDRDIIFFNAGDLNPYDERFTRRKGLNLSLSSGLDHMAGLVSLEHLDIVHMGTHELRNEAEMAWIEDHWPALNRLDGFWDRQAIRHQIREIRIELGTCASEMPASTPSERFARQAAKRRQENGVRLPTELDLSLNPLQKRLWERNIDVDHDLVDELLRMEGMETVAKSEKGGPHIVHRPNGGDDVVDEHGNKPELQRFSWFVRYVPFSWDNTIGPGGRGNEELMSYVMRPREGGRSPSPLGTWY